MNKVLTGLIAFAAIAALTPPSAADCTPSTSDPEVDLAGHYVDDDSAEGKTGSIWVYEESNELPGLQRGDSVVDDTCGGRVVSDTIIL